MPLQVKLQLLHLDVVMQPSAPEIRKAVAGVMSRLHETSQPFVRWMHGSCLEAAPVAGMQRSKVFHAVKGLLCDEHSQDLAVNRTSAYDGVAPHTGLALASMSM